MKTIHIYCDERYPDYGINQNSKSRWEQTIEVSDDFLADYLATQAAYEEMQKKLEHLIKQQNGPLG